MKTDFDNTCVRIILAEDDIDDQLLFQEALDAIITPTQLTIAKDGETLMNILKSRENALPDFIFLDMQMPRLNGIDCVARIKNDALLKDIPCIIFSTSSLDRAIAYEKGANLYAIKPARFESIVKIIEIVLSLDWKNYFPPPYEAFLLTESHNPCY